jgi:rhodanese-related sulfurtransferase
MQNFYGKKEDDNIKAILIGLFLIILIATITIFKSTSDNKDVSENKNKPFQPETIDSTKISKFTSEELAKKIQTNSNLILLDLRDETQYKNEHIIDSINIPLSKILSLPKALIANKGYVLITESGDANTINTAMNILLNNDYKNIYYLDGGFEMWKKKFNPTINDGDQKSFTDQAKVTYITSDDLKKRMEVEKNLIIIDVRKNTEFSTGHLPEAINIFLDDLEKKRKELPLGKSIILYDANVLGAFKGGVRLFDLGFSNTFALSDGLDNWKKKGYEVIK